MSGHRVSVTWDDGKYQLVVPSAGMAYILRYGEPWLGMHDTGFRGSKAVVGLAMELEESREQLAEARRKIATHARRVIELIEANNKLVEARRAETRRADQWQRLATANAVFAMLEESLDKTHLVNAWRQFEKALDTLISEATGIASSLRQS